MMAQSNFQTLTNGTVETRAAALVKEAEDTGGVPEAWAGFCSEAVLGMFQTEGQERLPEDVFALAISNLRI